MPDTTIIEKIKQYSDNIGIIDESGSYTYTELRTTSANIASYLLNGKRDLNEARVAFIIPSSFEYVSVLIGIWRAGGVAVPLCVTHPDPELEYVITNSGAGFVIYHPEFADRIETIAKRHQIQFASTQEAMDPAPCDMPAINSPRRAMIIYTSGTTSKPKGVVSTHANFTAQINALVNAWGWTGDDHILNVLPLHHLHGILNILLCALWAGAKCEMMPKFDAAAVWGKFIDRDLTMFMAVPTIYIRLIDWWEDASAEKKLSMSDACNKMRLMVSGSSALPVSVFEKWREISGHVLLERYGMTEVGMALSNPLNGERVPGHVGKPLPGVDIRLIDEGGSETADNEPGEILVKGNNVFLEYWNNPEATKASFLPGGWFKTGDIAVRNPGGIYKIQGRNSVDIIKSGGYKISALEIEEVLRDHPEIQEIAVVGVPDKRWGERVCAAIVTKGNEGLDPKSLRGWCKARLAVYKIPRSIVIVNELPRNAMGKVTKSEVANLF